MDVGVVEYCENQADGKRGKMQLKVDFNEFCSIQKRILAVYEQDFSNHAPVELIPKIRILWNSIPSQLAKEYK